ncbi:MAG: hypothetical protein OXE73_13835 [Gammaproteobacteria bacterium]|nr:hypothetical protein [Gammaproteobacteria bacterium]
MDEIKEQGIGFVQAGWRAVKVTAEKLPGADRVLGRDANETKTAPPEYTLVEDPPDALKKCYLSVLVWLVHFDDNRIDERELCEIQLQMTRMKCSADVRRAVRSYLEDPQSLEGKAQVGQMLECVPSRISDKKLDLKCSLMKDAIRVRRATSSDFVRGQRGIRRLAELLQLEDDMVMFLEEACEKEEEIFAGKLSDSQIREAAKSMAAKATGVGVPIAAIYVGGSVTGLSAAGITSGLAALGLGGMLGLSSMLTGIGVVIVAGGAAHKGVRWVLSRSERHRASLRELMLQEVLRIHQRAIINLGEDISFFGARVADLSKETDRNRAAIDRLFREVTLLSRSAGALARLGERAGGFERDLEAEAAGQSSR